MSIAISRRLAKNAFHPRIRRMAVKITLGDPIEHATGLEKRVLLAEAAGNTDPFNLGPPKHGSGTKDDPIQIPSVFDSRIVGCICTEEAHLPSYMWLHKDENKRCECGRWFTLRPATPL